jgi:hypothetical protein
MKPTTHKTGGAAAVACSDFLGDDFMITTKQTAIQTEFQLCRTMWTRHRNEARWIIAASQPPAAPGRELNHPLFGGGNCRITEYLVASRTRKDTNAANATCHTPPIKLVGNLNAKKGNKHHAKDDQHVICDLHVRKVA